MTVSTIVRLPFDIYYFIFVLFKGSYWIDPNDGLPNDAIKVRCEYHTKSTCLYPVNNSEVISVLFFWVLGFFFSCYGSVKSTLRQALSREKNATKAKTSTGHSKIRTKMSLLNFRGGRCYRALSIRLKIMVRMSENQQIGIFRKLSKNVFIPFISLSTVFRNFWLNEECQPSLVSFGWSWLRWQWGGRNKCVLCLLESFHIDKLCNRSLLQLEP